MKVKYGAIVAFIVVCIWSILPAAVLFEDTFDAKTNWVKAYGAPTESVANGAYTIESAAASMTMMKHNASFGTFTYTVKLKMESAFKSQDCGILFCMNDNLEFYRFGIYSNGVYSLVKYNKVGTELKPTQLAVATNSFITATDNVLQVSKSGSDINLFVNGFFLEKVTDSDFSQGSIGLYVGSAEKASFDYCVVTNAAAPATERTWFRDDFEDTNLDGWRLLQGDGITKSEDGVLKVAPTTGAVFLLTNGTYKDQPCTTIVTNKGGDANALYGLFFMRVPVSGSDFPSYYFLINGSRNYTVYSTTVSGTILSNSYITGVTDTLIVTKDYDFYINGHLIDSSTFSQGLDFNAVGVHVTPGASVEFDNFSAGVHPNVSIVNKPGHNLPVAQKPSYILGGPGLIYDTRGRKVASFENGYKETLKTLRAGPYFIVTPSKGTKQSIQRAVIVSP